MANIIKPKRSSVASKVPTTSDIVSGEIAVNSTDQKIYTNNGSAVVQIGAGKLSALGEVSITSPTTDQVLKYDGTNWVNASGGGGGVGDVLGPASSTDNAITRFDGTTGKLIQNSTVTLDDNGNVVNVNGITFDTTPTSAPTATGSMFWDSGNGALSVILDADVELQLGQENVVKVYNGTGSTITNGSVVAVSGAQGQRPSVVLADADSEPLSAGTLGIATEDIANGAEGFVTTFGLVRGLNTSAFVAGDPIYLSQTAGQFTKTRPAAPAHTVFLGWVISVNAASGEIFVNISNGWELDELHNVLITSPVNGNLLAYDATAGVWKNTNTIANNTVIEANNSTSALRITQTGAGNALLVEDSANPDATPFVVDASGQLVAGYTSQLSVGPNNQSSIFSTHVNSGANASFGRWTADTIGPFVNLYKSRSGTIGTRTIVNSGDSLGYISWNGEDGTTALTAARIDSYVDGTPGTNDMPGRLVFSTTADGASSPTERMRITSAGNVGIGGTPTAGRTFEVQKAVTGGVNGYSIVSRGEVQSDVTGSATYNWTFASTQNASFTLPQLRHNYAQQGTFGASSTVTNQYGYFADSSLTGATNNYGFYSNIASGTGRWNFYANGTADNYFGGDVIINVNTTDPALRITQVGSGNALLVEDSANPDATPFVVAADGRVVIGTTSAITPISGYSPQVQLSGTTTATSAFGINRFSADASPPTFLLGKSRAATIGSYDVVSSGDALGRIYFAGADGTAEIVAAQIDGFVDGTPGTNDMPGRLVFSTTADGASSPTERMRITSAGEVLVGATSLASSEKLLVNNSVNSTSNDTLVVSNPSTSFSGVTSGIGFFAGGADSNRQRAAIRAADDGAGVGRLMFYTREPIFGAMAERMRIDSNGNVGIGTSSPGYKLEVATGTSGLQSLANFRTANSTTANNAGLQIFATTSATASSRNVYAVWDADGADSVNSDYFYINKIGNSGNVEFNQTSNSNMLFYTNGTERARITSGGAFLVGKTTADAGVVGAELRADGTVVSTQTASTNSGDSYRLYSTGVSAYRFYVGMGGTIYATSTTISAISDQRLKENIQDIDVGLDAILALKPRKFDWKEGKGKNKKGDRGWIAQEFEQIFPEMIDTWKDPAPEGEEPYKSVNADLIPVLVKAIQELKTELDTVKSELQILKGN